MTDNFDWQNCTLRDLIIYKLDLISQVAKKLSAWFQKVQRGENGSSSGVISFEEITDQNEVDLEIIGQGSYGLVYKAKWNDSVIAVKKCSLVRVCNFRKEVHQLSRANHVNIVKFLGVSYDRKHGYLLMEYADCGSLHDYLHGKAQRELTMKKAIDWMAQCIKGICFLHSMKPKPMLHRDLKTQNLLLTDNYRTLKIADFGTATDLRTLMTDELGTAHYMAPEVMVTKEYTEKCDIYSFGIILWEVMTRRKPFYHLPNPIGVVVMSQAANGERPLLSDLTLPNTEKLQDLINKCWDGKPEKRPTANQIDLSLIPCHQVTIKKAIKR